MAFCEGNEPFVRIMRAARRLDEAGLPQVAATLRTRWLDLTPSHTRLVKNTDKIEHLAQTAEHLVAKLSGLKA